MKTRSGSNNTCPECGKDPILARPNGECECRNKHVWRYLFNRKTTKAKTSSQKEEKTAGQPVQNESRTLEQAAIRRVIELHEGVGIEDPRLKSIAQALKQARKQA